MRFPVCQDMEVSLSIVQGSTAQLETALPPEAPSGMRTDPAGPAAPPPEQPLQLVPAAANFRTSRARIVDVPIAHQTTDESQLREHSELRSAASAAKRFKKVRTLSQHFVSSPSHSDFDRSGRV